MPSLPRILENLPSVYRPEPGYDDDDLILKLSSAVGLLLDQLSESSAEVMQMHWFNYADSGIYSAWLGRQRKLNKLGPLALNDPEIDQFPYLSDLPRIAAMVDLSPWREPLRDKEMVEVFRRRVRRVVNLHKNGLGTLNALRVMTMIALPQIDNTAPEGLRERSFTVEEFSGTQKKMAAITQPGKHKDMVGPLMRWQIDSTSLSDVSPTIVIEGVEAQAGKIDPTVDPIIEQFDPGTGRGIGIHYQGSLAPGEALALVPGYASWLGGDGGIDSANSAPTAIEQVNPTAPGPWNNVAAGPSSGQIVDIQQTEDNFLWAAVNDSGGSLWRSDGTSWSEEFSGLPEIHCLFPSGGELLIGFETGLSRLLIQPQGGFTLSPDPAALTDPAVHDLAMDKNGNVWAATSQGLAQDIAGTLEYSPLGSRSETETVLHCLWIEESGDIYCGGERGLILHRQSQDRWYILQGESVDEAIDDWVLLDLDNGELPAAETILIPPVFAVLHWLDTDIWLGTENGIARYRAREQRRTYTTLVEALPHLTQTPVSQIALDARNRLWFATGEGLFVYDQLDWFQRQGDVLVRLPRQIEDPEKPVFWRFLRGAGNWQSSTPNSTIPQNSGFQDYSGSLVSVAQPPVFTITWTETAHARLGTFDGSEFTVNASATPAALVMRYKAEPTRIVDGGMVAMPRLLSGQSDWRYLQREEPSPPVPTGFPAWTREGRLLPPPDESPAPYEGRYLAELKAPQNSVFAFCPAARVWFLWQPRAPLVVTVRLNTVTVDEQIDPQILDRVWNELQRVKPAAVAVYLAVNETIVRG